MTSKLLFGCLLQYKLKFFFINLKTEQKYRLKLPFSRVLRYIFSKEFVYKPGSDGDHAQKALSSLINNNIIAQTSDSIKIIDFETATLVIDTIKVRNTQKDTHNFA